jgi:predicted permease
MVGRLFIIPLLVLLSIQGLGLPHPWVQVAVLQSAMPSMFLALSLALTFDLDQTLATNGIMASTFISLLTLPLWHFFLR